MAPQRDLEMRDRLPYRHDHRKHISQEVCIPGHRHLSRDISHRSDLVASLGGTISKHRSWRPAILLTLTAMTVVLGGCGSSSGDESDVIAQKIGASECSQSGYEIKSQLTGRSETVYDCLMGSGTSKCVTYTDGIANDSTEEVRLLFETVLGADKPSCLTD